MLPKRSIKLQWVTRASTFSGSNRKISKDLILNYRELSSTPDKIRDPQDKNPDIWKIPNFWDKNSASWHSVNLPWFLSTPDTGDFRKLYMNKWGVWRVLLFQNQLKLESLISFIINYFVLLNQFYVITIRIIIIENFLIILGIHSKFCNYSLNRDIRWGTNLIYNVWQN